MAGGLLGISVTGLRVSQTALNTTGHNIANAGVEGYSRQIVESATNPANRAGPGYIGSGVNVSAINRQVDTFIIEQLRQDTSLFNDLQSYFDNLEQLDILLSDVSTGLSGGLNSFFASLQNATDDPTSIPARQLLISESENLADRFNTLYGRFQVIEDNVETEIRTSVAQINSLAENIAELNEQISNALGNANGAQPNDLLDQRDEALRKLAEQVSIQVYEQGFGQVNVVIGSGQNLVVGTEARTLGVVAREDDASKIDIVFEGNLGGEIITDLLSGGELGGFIRFGEDVMDDAYNQLGRIAVVLADSFNQVHQSGINLNNQFGGNFFFDVNETTIARNRVIGNSNNALPNDRVLSLNILQSSELTTSDYLVEIDNGTLFRITRENDGEVVASDLLPGSFPFSVQFDGLELEFESGSFQSGDSFRLQPLKSGARDFSSTIVNPQDIAFGSPVLTDASLGNLGSGTISPGEVLSLVDNDGNSLPLLSTPGQMNPPLVVRFVSDTVYEVLDNSDPGNPVHLDPPIRYQRFIPGSDNNIFATDPGQTLVSTNGELIGIPVGRTPVVGGGSINNGYPAEVITITRPSSVAGAADITENIFTGLNASARETASILNNIDGVEANAFTYLEISDVNNLTLTSPLQINLNGEDLVEYEFDAGLGTFVVAATVPDPVTDAAAFNDYIADRINSNENLANLGIFALAAVNPTTGVEEIRVTSSEGYDLEVSLEADAGGPDSLSIGDGNNPTIALSGNGAGVTSAISVGGQIDVSLAEGLVLGTFPPTSMLFGDTTTTSFAQQTFTGIQATLGGVPQIGDSFTFEFNVNAALDNRVALDLVNLAEASTIGGGVLSFSDAYGAFVETIGIETSSVRINSDAAQQVVEQSTELRNSVSAVNLDEEAAELIKFEQMYQANAQVISVARSLFDTLINAF